MTLSLVALKLFGPPCGMESNEVRLHDILCAVRTYANICVPVCREKILWNNVTYCTESE